MKTILSICAARPNFVKVAAVHHALLEHFSGVFNHVIVHTGQHYDPLFSDIFFEELKIPAPAFNLGVHGGDRASTIRDTQSALEKVLPNIRPDIVFVYGDVNGVVGSAEAAKNLGFKIAHIEAGLRSLDLTMPEEHNRMMIDHSADILFCTEQSGVDHLTKEGVEGEVHLAGNVMIDTLLRMMPVISSVPLPCSVAGGLYALATLHRPSNVDDEGQLRSTFDFFEELSAIMPIVLPAHHRLKHALEQFRVPVPRNVHIIPPLGYLEFLRQMKDAAFILTDSGGIQEEVVLLGKRCFTLRENTERPATIESGSNLLMNIQNGTDRDVMLAYAKHRRPLFITVPQFWDGHAGERILRIVESFLA